MILFRCGYLVTTNYVICIKVIKNVGTYFTKSEFSLLRNWILPPNEIILYCFMYYQ